MLYLFLSVLLTLFFCSYIMIRIKVVHMKSFFFLSLAVSVYTFGYLLELNSTTLEQMVFWNQVQYMGIPFTSVLWFVVALRNTHTRKANMVKWWTLVLLFSIPLATFIFRLTNSFHHVFYSSLALHQVAGYSYLYLSKGPWYYVQSAYHLLMLFGVTLLFFNELKAGGHFKRTRNILLLISSFLPYVGMFLILMDYRELGLDYAVLFFPLSLLFIFVAVTKYGFLEMRSLAKGKIFEDSAEAILLLDMEHWIMDFNQSARDFFHKYNIVLRSGDLVSVFEERKDLIDILRNEKVQEFQGPTGRYFEIKTQGMQARGGYQLAMIKTISDITERKKIQAQLERMATIDELSQLNNREHFLELARKEFERAVRYHGSFSVLMIDIDRFKKINDRRGHAAGDTVIRYLGKMINERFRKTDISGRLGGEEFVVVLEGTSLHQASTLAEDFRQQVAQAEIKHGGEPIPVTVSIGISTFFPEAESFEKVLHFADEAMYQSKARGRNRVTVKAYGAEVPLEKERVKE